MRRIKALESTSSRLRNDLESNGGGTKAAKTHKSLHGSLRFSLRVVSDDISRRR